MRDLVNIRSYTTATGSGANVTDVVRPPGWAKSATIYLDVAAIAGTGTGTVALSLAYLAPASTDSVAFQWDGITAVAAAGLVVAHVGLENVDTEDDTTPVYFAKDPLPNQMNVISKLGTGGADTTYSLSLDIEYRS